MLEVLLAWLGFFLLSAPLAVLIFGLAMREKRRWK